MTAPVTSQGVSFSGVTGATKVTIKKSRVKPGENKLDASTLAITHGGNRVYEDGLPDNGPNGSTNDGLTVTATVEFNGATGPTKGTVVTRGGIDLKCTDVEITNDTGALVKGVANYTSDYV
jgi:hypothetical protein